MIYKALDVARWFIQRSLSAEKEQDFSYEKMTLLKLLKLLYYAEGCSLALNRGSLFNEEIRAWNHGPVVKSVWQKYRKDPYNLAFGTDADKRSVAKIEEKDADLLEQIFQEFGQYSAWGLRNMTHKEAPWDEATKHGTVLNEVISRDTMKDYFKKHYVAD